MWASIGRRFFQALHVSKVWSYLIRDHGHETPYVKRKISIVVFPLLGHKTFQKQTDSDCTTFSVRDQHHEVFDCVCPGNTLLGA